MDEKFYNLPSEKQQRIINAAYKVFSQNSYKKAPMSEIADEGGISKALLFYYFTNKKGLYLYLWNNAMELTNRVAKEFRVLDTVDFFEILKRNLLAKCSLMSRHPYIYAFSLKAYYEQYPEVKQVIQESFIGINQSNKNTIFDKIDTNVFRTDIDLKLMYAEITYALDGYLLNKCRSEIIVIDEIEKEVSSMISFWKQVYTEKRS